MNTRYFLYRVSAVAMLIFGITAYAPAQIPREISYQGLIAGVGGQPITDGSHTFEFKLYDSPSAIVPLHAETQIIHTSGGVFNAMLGTVTPFPSSLDFARQYWLGVSIDGTPELEPRAPLTAVAYALNSATADVAMSVSPDATGVVTSINEIDGPVRITSDSTINIAQYGNVITLSATYPEMPSVPFSMVESGVNRGQELVVGEGSSLRPVSGGTIESNALSGATVSVDATSASYSGRIKIPAGAATVQVRLSPLVGCAPNSSVTVAQFDKAGNEFLVGTMVTDITTDSFTVQFSATYPTDTGYLTYLVVNP